MFDLALWARTARPHNGRFLTIAIDGRGGSGKSSLARHLQVGLPGFTFLEGDDWYEPLGDPDAAPDFNDTRFIADVITPLQTGSSFDRRPWDWQRMQVGGPERLDVSGGLCFERCFSFGFALDWDLRIWVETPREVCLARGLERDKDLGEQILGVWDGWQAREDAYLAASDPVGRAHVVVRGLEPFEGQLRL